MTIKKSVVENKKELEERIYDILRLIGEDPERQGLIKTPHRVAKMFSELLIGYSKDLHAVVNGALYDAEDSSQEMVIVDSIPFSSLCEHHMLPFTGIAHVAYFPNKKIIGLSKIPRIVDMFASRLQVQERLTSEIADSIQEILAPKGIAVLLIGQHSCASLRGVKKHGVNMKTTSFLGVFRDNYDLKSEFYQLVK